MSMLEEMRLVQGILKVKAQKVPTSRGPRRFISHLHSSRLPSRVKRRSSTQELFVQVESPVFFSPQIVTSWSDILLDSPFDEAFYDEVINACGLRQDIEALPHRDMVKLGDKGAFIHRFALRVANPCLRSHSLGRTTPGTGRLSVEAMF